MVKTERFLSNSIECYGFANFFKSVYAPKCDDISSSGEVNKEADF